MPETVVRRLVGHQRVEHEGTRAQAGLECRSHGLGRSAANVSIRRVQPRERRFEGRPLAVEIDRDGRDLLFEQALPRVPTGHRLLVQDHFLGLAQQVRPVSARRPQVMPRARQAIVGEQRFDGVIGKLSPLELEEQQLRADRRRPLLHHLHARPARRIGRVGREVESRVTPCPSDEIVDLGERAHEVLELVGVELRDLAALLRQLVGLGIGRAEQVVEPFLAGSRKQRFEVPDDVVSGDVGGSHAGTVPTSWRNTSRPIASSYSAT